MKMKLFQAMLTSGFLTISILVTAQSPSFESYRNPVIPGDHPDATVTRIGNHFYTTGSSFNVTPVIYHSTDLVHWEAIAQPVKASWENYGDNPGGGCWGGQTVLHNGIYWNYFSRANTMYFVTANNPAGPWSEPVRVENPAELPYGLGYDNSIFIDDDNKWYLVVKNGQPNNGIVELGDDGQPTGVVYNLSWLNPAPDFPYSWAEGPVMWRYKGYYYYSYARDLTGGQKVLRSQTLTADESAWEMLGDFFNENDPLKPTSLFTSPNHASASVMLDDSTHWVIHPLYAKGEWKGQGRQGLLNEVHYDANLRPIADYPVNKHFTAPALPSGGIPWMVPKSDFFNSDKLNPEWSLLGFTLDNTFSLTERPGWLRLSPKSETKANTVLKNDGEHNYSLITLMDFDVVSSDDQAGLQVMRGDEVQFVKLYSSINEYGHKVIAFSYKDMKYEAENIIGNKLWLKIIRINHLVSGYFSKNGIEWIQVGDNFNISEIDSYSDYSTFTGTRQGLFAKGNTAFFDLYIYRDAYTPILAECPANQYGLIPTSITNGIYQLDSINNNDWALYAGVEFGNVDYPRKARLFNVTAASAGIGGTVEVWLDSIGTGTKIAECEITGTGDWNTFQTFSAEVDSVNGRHDVYMRFIGSGSERLFKITWFEFIAEVAPEFISAKVNFEDTLLLKLTQSVTIPSLPSGLSVVTNDATEIPIIGISFFAGDSSQLKIALGSPILPSDTIVLSYLPGEITNVNGVNLIPFNKEIVDNQLPGALARIKLLEFKNEGDTLWMFLSKKMNSPAGFAGLFALHIQGDDDILISSASLLEGDSSTIILIPQRRVYYEDLVTLSYTGTTLESSNGGLLNAFSNHPVINKSTGYPPILLSSSIRQYGSNYRYIDLTFDKPMLNAAEEAENFTVTLSGIPVEVRTISTTYDSLSLLIYPYIQSGDEILVSYSGGNVQSRYHGKLADFTNYLVPNTIPDVVYHNQNEDSEQPEILIFPNPASSMINISSDYSFQSVLLYDINGKVVLREDFLSPRKIATISPALQRGIYMLQLINSSHPSSRLILIE